MADKTLLQTLLGWLGEILGGAGDLLTGEDTRQAIIGDLGGKAGARTAPPQFPPAALGSINAYRDAAEPTLEGFATALADAHGAFETIRSFVETLEFDDASVTTDEVFRDLLDLLASNFVRQRLPRLYFILQAVGFEEEFTSANAGEYGSFVGIFRALRDLGKFVFSPSKYFDKQNFDSDVTLAGLSDRIALGTIAAYKIAPLIPGVKKIAKKIQANNPTDELIYGWDVVPGVPGGDASAPLERALGRMLTFKFSPDTPNPPAPVPAPPGPPPGTQTNTVLTSLALLPRTQGGPGLFVGLGGGWEIDAELSNPWYLSFEIQATGAVGALISKARKFELKAPGDGSDFRASVALEARPGAVSQTALNLDFGGGTGLRVGLLRFEGSLGKTAAVMKTALRDSAISLSPSLFGSFLGKLLPADGLRLAFDFEVGLASDRGLFFNGRVPLKDSNAPAPAPAPSTAHAPAARALAPASAAPPAPAPAPQPPLPPLSGAESGGPGLSLRIPIGKSLGPLKIDDLQLRVGVDDSGEVSVSMLEVAASITTELGPLLVRVDKIGVQLRLSEPADPKDANIGVHRLEVGPRLPQAIGLAIDAKGVLSGGGFVFHEPALELYAGVMALSLKERITLKAFGLIAMKMPDGSPGFSMIIFITAEDFQPIPVGMAATLQGIGGMVAIHRTFDEAAMREGLKNNTLGTLLFPKDPIRHAPEIIRNLALVFPARRGCYMFGVLAKFGWFSPTLVTLDLALILEFGARLRLIALGRIQSLLPSKDEALIQLNLDAMGLIDFDEGKAEIDAMLVDSRLAKKFVLTGAMALRVRWTSGPGAGFALAIGGLNPRSTPPVGIPKLERVAIALSSGDNPRLTCEAYFAFTSNTIQFGARAQLYASAIGFTVEGDVGFDVLIQFAPFHFIADFHASLQLRRGSRNLFKVSVDGALEGPRPLRVSGKASFEILWCDFTVRFDKTLIDGELPPLPPAVDVLGELTRALGDAQSWTSQREVQQQHGVALRKLAVTDKTLVLDPLGTLTVKQQVVPLNTSRDIDLFGGAPPAGARRFAVLGSITGASTQTVGTVTDQFAPAQFFSMSDDEKLVSPSFQTMQAGLSFGTDELTFDAGLSVASPLSFETIVIDAAGVSSSPPEAVYPLSVNRLALHVRHSAVARAAVRGTGAARFRDSGAPQAAQVQELRWVVAALDDTATRASGVNIAASWSELRSAAATLNRGGTRWQVVPIHEAA